MGNRAFSKIWIIMILVISVAGGISAWQYSRMPAEKTTDWNTYRDEKQRYEIQYPKTWSIVETREDFGIEFSRIIFQSEDYKLEESEEYKEIVAEGEETGLLPEMVMVEGAMLELVITEISPDPKWCIGLFEDVSLDCTWREWARRPTDYPFGELISEGFVTIEGKEMYKREVRHEEITYILISFPDPKETKLFELMLHTLKKGKEKNLDIFNQILATFRFLE